MLQYIARAEKRGLHNSSLDTLSYSILPYIQRDVSISLEIVFPNNRRFCEKHHAFEKMGKL